MRRLLELALKRLDEGQVFDDTSMSWMVNIIRNPPVWLEWNNVFFESVSLNALRTQLINDGIVIGGWAQEILDNTHDMEIGGNYTMIGQTVGELMFPDGATRTQIFERAQDFGLGLCPVHLALVARAAHRNQHREEGWLVMGMEPVETSGGDSGLLSLGYQDDKLWLGAASGRSEAFYGPQTKFLFYLS